MTTKRKPMVARTADTPNGTPTHHFFASSMGRWLVDYDPAKLVAAMKRDGLPFNLFLVPGDIDTSYDILWFTPQVEGVTWLALYA